MAYLANTLVRLMWSLMKREFAKSFLIGTVPQLPGRKHNVYTQWRCGRVIRFEQDHHLTLYQVYRPDCGTVTSG